MHLNLKYMKHRRKLIVIMPSEKFKVKENT